MSGDLPPPPTSAAARPGPQPQGPLVVPEGSTIVVDGVSKAFGPLVAVSEVSFAVGPGVTALLGPNGAGKSTLLRVLCGLTPASRGTVWVAGGDPRTSAEARGNIGLVPQQDGVFERDSLYDFVHLAAVLSGVPNPVEAVQRALASVELDPNIDRPIGAFSKGMRQRAKIAAALVHSPTVMVLDEPLNGLDPKQRRQMIDLFHQLGEAGVTVLVSSHVLDEVERFGSNVLVISKGRIAAKGDFRAIRGLMNDQPLRYRIECSNPRRVGAVLLDTYLVNGCDVTGPDSLEITTNDAAAFRTEIARICVSQEVRLTGLTPLDDDLESVFRYLVGPS
jgi:ABC-2 type transport system ATP-binding protein